MPFRLKGTIHIWLGKEGPVSTSVDTRLLTEQLYLYVIHNGAVMSYILAFSKTFHKLLDYGGQMCRKLWQAFHANNHYLRISEIHLWISEFHLRISVNNFGYPKFIFQYPKIR